MSKTLAQLLGNDHPLFTFNLEQLERASGGESISSRLVADMIESAHTVMRRLQLDPTDTAPRELYQALLEASKRPDAQAIFKTVDFVLATIGGEVLSFNLYDLIESAHHHLPFEARLTDHAKRRLRTEIIKRYASHDKLDNELVKKIASEIDVHHHADSHFEQMDQLLLGQGDTGASAAKPSILMIGDIITDAFIKLSEDYAEVKTDENGYKRLSFELGAKIPYDQVDIVEAVECSPNAAVSAARLGLDVRLMAWLGDDEPGRSMISYLAGEAISDDELIVEKGMKTNYHYVLRYGSDRTKLQKFEDYSYEWKQPKNKPDWIYLGVLGEKTWPLHQGLLGYLEENPDIKLVFQPGMYHLMWGTEKLKPFYEKAEVVIMNREEAAQVTGKGREDVKVLLRTMHELGVRVAVITDGADGAYASDMHKRFFMPNYPDPSPPYDRTGAGDAFASTIAASLVLGKSLEEALRWAPVNSASVVQQLGAQRGLLRFDELQEWLERAPSDYRVSEL